MPLLGCLRRLVLRIDEAVCAVVFSGRTAWHDGVFASGLGTEHGFGGILRAQEPVRA